MVVFMRNTDQKGGRDPEKEREKIYSWTHSSKIELHPHKMKQWEEIVAPAYADASRIIVIWDNLNTHYDGKDERWTKFNERHGGKFVFVYTPKHASWMNQVEIFFSIVHRRVLKHGSFTSVEDLAWKVMAFIERWNAGEGHPFNWTFRGYPMQSEPKVAA